MNIEAICGCGARVNLRPAGYNECGYGNYTGNRDAVAREERDAVAAAFKLWAQSHSNCRTFEQAGPFVVKADVPVEMADV